MLKECNFHSLSECVCVGGGDFSVMDNYYRMLTAIASQGRLGGMCFKSLSGANK